MWQNQPTPNNLTDIQNIFITAITIGAMVAGVWVGIARTLNGRDKRKTDEHKTAEIPASIAADYALGRATAEKNRADKLKKELEEAQESIDALAKANGELSTDIRAKNALIDGLRLEAARVPALESQLTALKVQVASLTAEKTQWQTERDSLTARNALLLKQYQEAIEANAPKPPPPPVVDEDTGGLLPAGD